VGIYSDIKPTGICAVSKNRPTLVKTSNVQKDVMSFLLNSETGSRTKNLNERR
jgi:hypothetical protein